MKKSNYKSKFEESVAEDLERLKIKAHYEPSKLPYIIESYYVPDWMILPNGIILEAKGKLDAITRRKMLAVKRKHPHLDIRFVFMRAKNRITKGSSTTYGDWATKNGFKWCELPIPKGFLR